MGSVLGVIEAVCQLRLLCLKYYTGLDRSGLEQLQHLKYHLLQSCKSQHNIPSHVGCQRQLTGFQSNSASLVMEEVEGEKGSTKINLSTVQCYTANIPIELSFSIGNRYGALTTLIMMLDRQTDRRVLKTLDTPPSTV